MPFLQFMRFVVVVVFQCNRGPGLARLDQGGNHRPNLSRDRGRYNLGYIGRRQKLRDGNLAQSIIFDLAAVLRATPTLRRSLRYSTSKSLLTLTRNQFSNKVNLVAQGPSDLQFFLPEKSPLRAEPRVRGRDRGALGHVGNRAGHRRQRRAQRRS